MCTIFVRLIIVYYGIILTKYGNATKFFSRLESRFRHVQEIVNFDAHNPQFSSDDQYIIFQSHSSDGIDRRDYQFGDACHSYVGTLQSWLLYIIDLAARTEPSCNNKSPFSLRKITLEEGNIQQNLRHATFIANNDSSPMILCSTPYNTTTEQKMSVAQMKQFHNECYETIRTFWCAYNDEIGQLCEKMGKFALEYLNPELEILKINVNGTVLDQLTNNTVFDGEQSISSDGQWVVYTSMESGDPDLWIMDVKGRQKRQLTNRIGYEGGASFSPDSKHVVFHAGPSPIAEEIEVYNGLLRHNYYDKKFTRLMSVGFDGNDMQVLNVSCSDNGKQSTSEDLEHFKWPTYTADGNILFQAVTNSKECDSPDLVWNWGYLHCDYEWHLFMSNGNCSKLD